MTQGWGPQATGGVTVQNTRRSGTYWVVYAIFSPFIALFMLVGVLNRGRKECSYNADWQRVCTQPEPTPSLQSPVNWLIWTTCIVGFALGVNDGRKGTQFAHGRTVSAVVAFLFNWWSVIAYAVGFGLGRMLSGKSFGKIGSFGGSKNKQLEPRTDREFMIVSEDPYRQIMHTASHAYGLPGGHIGWNDYGNYIGSKPRGGMLVLGPPGSGKTVAVIIPSVLVAPGACVSSSIKVDVMDATAEVRALVGRTWHFDPGGAEHPAPGVIAAKWSPLVSIRTWDDARIVADRLAAPAMKQGKGGDGGGDDHFAERARDWLEVLLFAAVLDNHPISTVADWAQNPDSQEVEQEVNGALIYAAQNGDPAAKIASGQLRGLLDTPDKERGSIKSTLNRLLRIYGSLAARQIGDEPNFDPRQFVRSADTLYITASPERQKQYAPLIAGLLEEIRFATYARHKAEEAGLEPRRPHVTFVLDEANNTAPIPLPDIISEAGGQSLHIIVGIQDLSRARERWGKAADGFLTLFPTKLVLNGVVEPYTLDALSNASGEYDRVMMGYSESTSYVGQYNMPIRQQNPNYSTTRQKVLHQGDIARLPQGKALLFEGAEWSLINLGMHWQDPVWRRVIGWAKHQRPIQQVNTTQQFAQTNPAALNPGPTQGPTLEKREE